MLLGPAPAVTEPAGAFDYDQGACCYDRLDNGARATFEPCSEPPVQVDASSSADSATHAPGGGSVRKGLDDVDLRAERGGMRPTPLTNSQATDLARWNGFESTGARLRGQTVFRKPGSRQYIVQDLDSHLGGTWKMARSPEALRSKSTRLGTYDEQLNRLGP